MHYYLIFFTALSLWTLSINGQQLQQRVQPQPQQQQPSSHQQQPQSHQQPLPQQQQQQQCDFSVYDNCVKSIFQQKEQENSRQGGGDGGHFDEKVKGCFKSAGCKEPNFNDNSDDKNMRPPFNNDMEKRRQCFVKNNKNAKAIVEQCVQKTIPNFHFPTDDDSRNSREQRERPIGGFRGGQGNMAQRINQSCPDSTSRDNVNGCLRNLWHPSQPRDETKSDDSNERRRKAEERLKELCSKKDACFKQLSPQCQKQYNDSKAAACNCAQNELKSKSAEFDRNLDQCMGQTAGPNSNPNQQTNSNNENGWSRKRSSVDRTIRKMCQTDDMCKNGLPNHNHEMGPHRPPLHQKGGSHQ